MNDDLQFWSQLSFNPIDKIYNEIEIELLKNIAEKFKLRNTDYKSLEWDIKKLNELGKLNKENAQIIKNLIKELDYETYYKEIQNEEISILDELLKKAKLIVPQKKTSEYIKEILKNYTLQAEDQFNLTNSSLLENSAQIYKDIVSKTSFKLASGISTPSEALSESLKEISVNGIPVIKDKAGRKWNTESYVSMINQTTVGNIVNKTQDQRMKEWGVNLIEVSSHNGARPLCARDQGKIYSLDGRDGTTKDGKGTSISYTSINSTSYGQKAGLFGINCRHIKYPFVPNFSWYEPEKIDKEENAKTYKLTQQQRYMEREIRKSRRILESLKSAGLDDKLERQKLKRKLAKIKEFTSKHDLTRIYMNERI